MKLYKTTFTKKPIVEIPIEEQMLGGLVTGRGRAIRTRAGSVRGMGEVRWNCADGEGGLFSFFMSEDVPPDQFALPSSYAIKRSLR